MAFWFDFLQDYSFPHDTGPVYKETIAGRLPVEPFNTYSNLIFLFILIYFGNKVYRNPQRHKFLAIVIPVIFIGYIGGTIYHATRSNELWLLLDWVPIMIASLASAIYFIFKWQRTWVRRLGFMLIILMAFFGSRQVHMPHGLQISVGYAITALTILIPLGGYLYRTKWHNLKYVIYAFGIFALAVLFRVLDKRVHFDIFWMGTHWLWHLLGGIAVFFLMKYIFEDNKEQAVIIS
ncbi:hypothetical protein ACH3O9_07850 [Leeuwenhoekiella sp. A16]|uniref:hypothetical protein n=1 Tax=unclassified Leeuwenhoekiella TaxID=2615029 RepID=UPI003A800ECE